VETDPIVNSPLHGGYHTVDEAAATPSRPQPPRSAPAHHSIMDLHRLPAPRRQQSEKPEKSWLALQWAGVDKK
jgi:hypothetical protein